MLTKIIGYRARVAASTVDKFNHIFARQTRAYRRVVYLPTVFYPFKSGLLGGGKDRARVNRIRNTHTRIRKRGSGTRLHASRLRSILSIRVELANVIDFRSKQIYRWLGPSRLHVLTRNALEYRILTV